MYIIGFILLFTTTRYVWSSVIVIMIRNRASRFLFLIISRYLLYMTVRIEREDQQTWDWKNTTREKKIGQTNQKKKHVIFMRLSFVYDISYT